MCIHIEQPTVFLQLTISTGDYRHVCDFLLMFVFAFQEREKQEQMELERMEAFKRQIIEEERQRLLQEHAAKLVGYLPKVRYK